MLSFCRDDEDDDGVLTQLHIESTARSRSRRETEQKLVENLKKRATPSRKKADADTLAARDTSDGLNLFGGDGDVVDDIDVDEDTDEDTDDIGGDGADNIDVDEDTDDNGGDAGVASECKH